MYVARIEDSRGVYRVLVGKPEGKRPLGRLRRRWELYYEDGSSGSGMEAGWGGGLRIGSRQLNIGSGGGHL